MWFQRIRKEILMPPVDADIWMDFKAFHPCPSPVKNIED
jgi:hypothetical protein